MPGSGIYILSSGQWGTKGNPAHRRTVCGLRGCGLYGILHGQDSSFPQAAVTCTLLTARTRMLMNVWLPCSSCLICPHLHREEESAILGIPRDVSHVHLCVTCTSGSRILLGSRQCGSVLAKLALGDIHTFSGPAWLHPPRGDAGKTASGSFESNLFQRVATAEESRKASLTASPCRCGRCDL